MLCNITQNTMGQEGGTLPGPVGGVPYLGGYPGQGGTLAGGVTLPGGGGYPAGGSTQLGQHREYLLHGGRYASCIHAGGLSSFQGKTTLNKFYIVPVLL